jgi:hypothetical protein
MTEACTRRIGANFEESCPTPATGGLRVTLRPAETVEKRWGRKSLLTFVMDLPLCPSCFPKVSITEVIDPDLRQSLARTAQKMNNGVLVDWSRTLLEHVPFDDPYYIALRGEMDKRAAENASQPVPAGPQQGAGHEPRT